MSDATIRLYLPPRTRPMAGGRRDPLLDELGAPLAGGIFEAADRHLARQAVWGHRVGLVDPVDGESAVMAWCAMQRDREAPATYVGPQLFFDPAAFIAPVLPPGGLTSDATFAAYMAGAPVHIENSTTSVSTARLSVRQASQPPSPLWRRTVPAPRLNYPRYPAHHEKWTRWEFKITSVPAPKHLANWLSAQREGWWTKFATHRFLADAAESAIIAYDSQARAVPASYWQSDVDFDPDGDLYLRSDRRTPLYRRLRFHAAADVPALAVDRAARALGDVKAAILEALAEHAADFEGMSIAERVAILGELLPFSIATIRTFTYRAYAGARR
jgi:hypothetical protein